MYEELECGCIIKKNTYSMLSLEQACAKHYAKGMLSKGFSKLKVVKRYKHRPKQWLFVSFVTEDLKITTVLNRI